MAPNDTDTLADLIADAQSIQLPRPRTRTADPAPQVAEIVIPDDLAHLVDGYADYGA